MCFQTKRKHLLTKLIVCRKGMFFQTKRKHLLTKLIVCPFEGTPVRSKSLVCYAQRLLLSFLNITEGYVRKDHEGDVFSFRKDQQKRCYHKSSICSYGGVGVLEVRQQMFLSALTPRKENRGVDPPFTNLILILPCAEQNLRRRC